MLDPEYVLELPLTSFQSAASDSTLEFGSQLEQVSPVI